MNEQTEDKRFYIAATYISAKVFLPYVIALTELYDLKIKGQKSAQTKTIECANHVSKYVACLEKDLKGLGINLDIAGNEIENAANIIFEILRMDSEQQRRICGLINKMEREKTFHIRTSQELKESRCNAYEYLVQ